MISESELRKEFENCIVYELFSGKPVQGIRLGHVLIKHPKFIFERGSSSHSFTFKTKNNNYGVVKFFQNHVAIMDSIGNNEPNTLKKIFGFDVGKNHFQTYFGLSYKTNISLLQSHLFYSPFTRQNDRLILDFYLKDGIYNINSFFAFTRDDLLKMTYTKIVLFDSFLLKYHYTRQVSLISAFQAIRLKHFSFGVNIDYEMNRNAKQLSLVKAFQWKGMIFKFTQGYPLFEWRAQYKQFSAEGVFLEKPLITGRFFYNHQPFQKQLGFEVCVEHDYNKTN